MNSRLDTVQAAILQVKFRAFKGYELDAVNEAAVLYTSRLQGFVGTPVIPEGFRSSWAQYTIRLQDRMQRDAVQSALKAAGIPAMVYYPKPMHLQTAFSTVIPSEAKESSSPVATSLCERVLSLPMHPYISAEDIDTVCNIILKTLA